MNEPSPDQRITESTAYQRLLALLMGGGARDVDIARSALASLIAEVRCSGAEIVLSLIPRNPDGDETEQAITWALEHTADAVERGRR